MVPASVAPWEEEPPLPASREVWPSWVGLVLAAMVTVVVVAVAADSRVAHRGVVVPLLVVVASTWYLEVAGLRPPTIVKVVVTLGIVGTVNVGADRFGWADASGDVQVSLMIVLLMVGEVVAHARPWLVVSVIATTAVITSPPVLPYDFDEEYVWSVGLALSVMSGVFVRALLRALRRLETAQDELAARAASEERRRIAREVHDVVAHSLTVTMLHLTAARLAVARGEGVAATQALEEAERAGRQSIADVRSTVGLLRNDDEVRHGAAQHPMPVGSDLPALISEYRAAGLPVELTVSGDVTTLEPGVSLALYRIVQESLANVARHAPGAQAVVAVAVGDPVHVRVQSTGGSLRAVTEAGAGLVGMRERAEALGGTYSSGPAGDDWVVSATLPTSRSAASRELIQ